MTPYLLLGATYGFAAAVMPGPFAAFLISYSLAHGWRRSAPVAVAPLLTDGPIALLVLALLSQVPSGLVQGLRIVGGLFVLYLAVEAWRAFRRFDPEASAPTGSAGNSLWKAAAVNALSPGPYLGWSLVLGPLFLEGWARSHASGLAVVAGFYATMVTTLLAMILLFSAARSLGTRVNRILLGISSLALALFGGYQLWLGGRSL
jgi:threonine/homoserine/homoserine lactone efflux protein